MRKHGWWVVLGVCLAVAVLAPLGWFATRPADSAGVPVTSVGASGPADSATPPSPGSATPGGRPAARPFPSARPAAPQNGRNDPILPVRLRIPAIGVAAAIDPVGVEKDGSMVIPREVDRVGWYRYGAAPGAETGAAVLAGHVDSRTQGRGALFELREIDVGDRVEIQLRDGGTVIYRAVGRETLTKTRLPTERLFARDGTPRLVLITCGGPFIPELSSYRDNLVVVAEPAADSG